jgi:HAE1 family hydrophobic/amphiphilic exporter-1
MRQSLGVTVFSGMLGVTFFGLFLTPVFYVTIRGITHRLRPARRGPDPEMQPSGGAD